MIPSRSNFIHRIETEHHPLSLSYKLYWKEMKRRCIEGFWYEGRYMPGPLYFYGNFARISLIETSGRKQRSIGTPTIRDIEWEKAYVYLEAKGFSGFKNDTTTTCSKWIELIEQGKEELVDLVERGKIRPEDCANPESFPLNIKLKKFEDPRTYLRKIHLINKGKPLFFNNAKNVIDIEARRLGKSMVAANMLINHNFLFDGATDYDLYLDAQKSGRPMNSETLVGAIDAKYTKDLLSKSELGLSNLPGIKTVNGITYPSPLSKQVVGTFQPGKYMEASYKVKSLGGWTVKGSRSKIHNRSFADNPLAGNGTGPNLIVLEEVGFMNNLIDTLGALKDAMYEGLDKFGVLWATGTSGEMDAAAVSQTKEVFFNPETYDCLAFENIYEESKSIGMFIPFTYRLDEFRDSEGNIDLVKANRATEIKRENIRKLGNKRTYYSEMQNNPLLPSEAFLVNNANIFPTAELKEHVNWLQSMQHKVEIKGQNGELVFSPNEKGEIALNWKPDLNDKLEPCHYNMKKNDSTQGCIVIWEHPQMLGGTIPYGMYIAGNDPYDQDQAPSSVSLGSTFIYKTFHTSEGIYEWPVAEYTARPGSANEHHETVRKLLLYYNAVLLYENERNTLKMHFEQKNSLYLLAKTPTILKSTENSKVQRTYGIHMNAMIKDEIEIYTRDWLQTEIEEGKLNLHKINSIPLLLELINYNKTGNFDRVIAFMLVILYRLQLHHLKVKEVTKEKSVGEDFFNRLNKFYR